MEIMLNVQATAEAVLDALAAAGIAVDQARADGHPVDVGPWRERAVEVWKPATASGTATAAVFAPDAATATQASAPDAAQEGDGRPIPGVDLTERAGEIAVAAGLTAADFVGRQPSGRTGYTVADVEAILAARER